MERRRIGRWRGLTPDGLRRRSWRSPMNAATRSGEEEGRFIKWWASVISTAVLINVVQFPFVESSASRWYKAIPPYESGDVREIALSHMPTVRINYGLEFTLAGWARDATLTVFEGSELAGRSDMYVAFERVDIADYNPVLSRDLSIRLADHIVAAGTDKDLGDFGVAVTDKAADHLTLVFDGERALFVESGLLPAGFAGDSR